MSGAKADASAPRPSQPQTKPPARPENHFPASPSSSPHALGQPAFLAVLWMILGTEEVVPTNRVFL